MFILLKLICNVFFSPVFKTLSLSIFVIASEAKQSRTIWIATPPKGRLAMT